MITIEDLCACVNCTINQQQKAQEKIEAILIFLSYWGVIDSWNENILDGLFSDKECY